MYEYVPSYMCHFSFQDEYQFLYQMAAEYISRNNTYANL